MFSITNIWYVTYLTRTEVEQKSITMSRIQPWDWMGWERSRKFLIKCHFGQLFNLSQFRYILPVFLGEKCENGWRFIECQKSQAKESTWWFRNGASDVLPRPSSTYGLKYIAVILTLIPCFLGPSPMLRSGFFFRKTLSVTVPRFGFCFQDSRIRVKIPFLPLIT